MYILIFIVWIGSAILCSIIAKKKNRDSFGWGVIGFLFGFLALIAIMVLSPLKTSVTIQGTPEVIEEAEPPPEMSAKTKKNGTLNETLLGMTKSDKKYFAILILATTLAVLIFHFTINPTV